MSWLGRVLIVTGAAIIIVGVALLFLDKAHFALPGDIVVKRKNFTFYFPLGLSIFLSLLLTAIFFVINLFRR